MCPFTIPSNKQSLHNCLWGSQTKMPQHHVKMSVAGKDDRSAALSSCKTVLQNTDSKPKFSWSSPSHRVVQGRHGISKLIPDVWSTCRSLKPKHIPLWMFHTFFPGLVLYAEHIAYLLFSGVVPASMLPFSFRSRPGGPRAWSATLTLSCPFATCSVPKYGLASAWHTEHTT